MGEGREVREDIHGQTWMENQSKRTAAKVNPGTGLRRIRTSKSDASGSESGLNMTWQIIFLTSVSSSVE